MLALALTLTLSSRHDMIETECFFGRRGRKERKKGCVYIYIYRPAHPVLAIRLSLTLSAQPSPAQPSPAQPSPAQPSPAQSIPIQSVQYSRVGRWAWQWAIHCTLLLVFFFFFFFPLITVVQFLLRYKTEKKEVRKSLTHTIHLARRRHSPVLAGAAPASCSLDRYNRTKAKVQEI